MCKKLKRRALRILLFAAIVALCCYVQLSSWSRSSQTSGFAAGWPFEAVYRERNFTTQLNILGSIANLIFVFLFSGLAYQGVLAMFLGRVRTSLLGIALGSVMFVMIMYYVHYEGLAVLQALEPLETGYPPNLNKIAIRRVDIASIGIMTKAIFVLIVLFASVGLATSTKGKPTVASPN